jgi:oligoendopeptidase F
MVSRTGRDKALPGYAGAVDAAMVAVYPEMQDPDRARREQAWRTFNERKLEDREALFEVWSKGLQVRQQIARNAGYDNYREYRWQQLYRFDYTPDDCKACMRRLSR